MWLSPGSVQPTAVCAASAVHNMGWRRSRQCQSSVVRTPHLFGENGMMREKISPQTIMDKDDKENRKVTFNFGYFYTCAFCSKVLTDRSELEEHLEDDHEDEDVDESFLDGPMFRVRKIQFYLDKVCSMIILYSYWKHFNCPLLDERFERGHRQLQHHRPD